MTPKEAVKLLLDGGKVCLNGWNKVYLEFDDQTNNIVLDGDVWDICDVYSYNHWKEYKEPMTLEEASKDRIKYYSCVDNEYVFQYVPVLEKFVGYGGIYGWMFYGSLSHQVKEITKEEFHNQIISLTKKAQNEARTF